MRIAFITFEYPPFIIGGAGVYAYNLTKELVKLGNEVVVFTPKFESIQTDEINGLKIIGVKVDRRLPLVSVQFWLNLPKALENAHSDNPFNIVHINGTSYWFIPGKIIEVPHFVTIHHLSRDAKGDGSKRRSYNFQLVGESSIIYQYLENRCIGFADRIIAVSNFTKRRITEIYDVSDDRIEVIYNGYTPLCTKISDEEINKFKKRFNLDSQTLILFVGRIDDPRKGLDNLLDAFYTVSKNVKIQLLVVGKGNKELVLKKARNLGIDKIVTVTGFLNPDDLACSYSICDVYVCPSLMEGFGLTILEAASHGNTIVATNVGAIPEIIISGVYYAEPNNPESLAKALLLAIINKGIKKDIDSDYLLKFTWPESAKATEYAYSNL